MKGLLFWFDKFLRDAGMQRDVLIVGGIVCLMLVMFVSPGSAYTQNFQNDATSWSGGSVTAYTWNELLGYSIPQSGMALYTPQIAFNYYAFTLVSGTNGYLWPRDINGAACYATALYPNYTLGPGRYVIIRANGYWTYTWNGIQETWHNDGLYNEPSGTNQPYTLQIGSYSNPFIIDDVTIGTTTGTDVVGLPPHNWFVGNDVINHISGVFDNNYNNVYSSSFHYTISSNTSYTVSTYTLPNPIPSSGQLSVISGSASDYINCKGVTLSGSSVNWTNPSSISGTVKNYIDGDQANVTWNTGTNYWLPSSYIYKLNIYLQNPTTNALTLVKSYPVSAQTGNQIIDTSTFAQGSYIATCSAYPISAPTQEYYLAYDWMYLNTGMVKVYGYVIDAVTGSHIISQVVGIQQGGAWNNATSDATGYYSQNSFTTGQPITFLVSKTGYQTHTFTFTPQAGGNYLCNMYMDPVVYSIPDYPNPPGTMGHSGTAIAGYCVDISTNTTISGASVTMAGVGTTTTAANGSFIFDSLTDSTPYTMTASEANYVNGSAAVTTGAPGSLSFKNIYMQPINTISGTGTIVYGYVLSTPFGMSIPNANVTLNNATWSSSQTTNTGGFFQFNDLNPASNYTLSGAATGFNPASLSVTTGAANSATYKELYLDSRFSLTITAKDASTTATIGSTPVEFIMSTGADQIASTGGTTTFTNLPYGSYTFTAAASGYTPGTGAIVLIGNSNTTVYLNATAVPTYPTYPTNQNVSGIGGSGSMYPPHQVRFFMLDNYDRPLSYLNVTATPIESTAPWAWLTSWLGINSTVNVQGTTLTGTTGLDGSWDTMMVENVRYNISVVNLSQGINYQFSLYPLDDTYRIFLQVFNKKNASYYPNATLWAEPYNATWISLNMSYFDPNGRTPLLVFYVMDATYSVLYNKTWNSSAAGYTNWSYQVPNTKGDMYFWGINATNTDFGTINRAQGITMKGTGPLVDFGLTDNTWYIWFALLLMFLVAGIFSAKHIPLGVIVTPLWGGALFWYIGWLPTIAAAGITVAGAIGVLVYMRKKEYQLRV